MGFDPRDWSAASQDSRNRQSRGERVTSNVEALLRENDALRREVQRLELELDRFRRRQWQRTRRESSSHQTWQQSSSQPPRVTATQVQRWGASLADQTGWTELRATGLVALIERLLATGIFSHFFQSCVDQIQREFFVRFDSARQHFDYVPQRF